MPGSGLSFSGSALQPSHMLESQVLEMWGFAITTLKVGLKQTTLHWKMMCQIPYDEEPPEGPEHFIMHYTYGMVGPIV